MLTALQKKIFLKSEIKWEVIHQKSNLRLTLETLVFYTSSLQLLTQKYIW